MGLFSKKKKPSPAEIAAQEQAEQQRIAQAAAALREREVAAAREAKEKERQREEKTFGNIEAKKKDIKMLENAITAFEADRKKEALLAIKAKKEKKLNAAQIHMRNAKRLEGRIKNYQARIQQNQSQLDALEDAASMIDNYQGMKKFNEDIKESTLDVNEVEEKLQDMREVMSEVQAVNDAYLVDAEMHKPAYDNEEALADLEAEFADELEEPEVVNIPSVPGTVPKMPTPASAMEDEDEEIRKLEADVGL